MTTPKSMKYESERDHDFSEWITGVVGSERIRNCIQCGICSSTCPVSHYMDYTPRRLINMARQGFKDEVLRSKTIWLCTSCYSCTTECPKLIKVTDVMYALKRKAIQERVYPRRFAIPILGKEFYKMVRAKGRITESRLMMIFMLKTNLLRIFTMSKMGLRLIRTGRMDYKPESVKRIKELQAVMDASSDRKGVSTS
ncbi:MAG: 4Fe-4S dicluster domain-containing protein [Candidatus Omnitrophica bacterium]|nr:4Fe-4S dicluster domain-containing protein [Candidatus Omnitrophota bacterium]